MPSASHSNRIRVARSLPVLGAEQAVGEFLAVVGQEPGDLDRAGLVQRLQEGLGGGRRLVGCDGDEHQRVARSMATKR